MPTSVPSVRIIDYSKDYGICKSSCTLLDESSLLTSLGSTIERVSVYREIWFMFGFMYNTIDDSLYISRRHPHYVAFHPQSAAIQGNAQSLLGYVALDYKISKMKLALLNVWHESFPRLSFPTRAIPSQLCILHSLSQRLAHI